MRWFYRDVWSHWMLNMGSNKPWKHWWLRKPSPQTTKRQDKSRQTIHTFSFGGVVLLCKAKAPRKADPGAGPWGSKSFGDTSRCLKRSRWADKYSDMTRKHTLNQQKSLQSLVFACCFVLLSLEAVVFFHESLPSGPLWVVNGVMPPALYYPDHWP